MSQQQGNPDKDEELWVRLVESHMTWLTRQGEFFAPGVDRVTLMRNALKRGDSATAFVVAEIMSVTELQALFPEWIEWAATSHGYVHAARDIIKSLPSQWVLDNVRAVAEPLLASGTYDEYRRLLELYFELDRDLTLELASRAVQSADEDIKEAGEDFLEKLATPPASSNHVPE
jgi:hypothetical protein